MPVTSSAPIALRYSVSIRPWAHAKLIQQNVLTVTSTESKSSNTASLVVLPAAGHRQTPLPRTVGDLSGEPGAYFLQTAEWVFRENRLARGCFPALGRQVLLSKIIAPIFVLAAADDEIVALPQATAVKALCRATNVAVRIEPGRHLSLF